MVEFGFPIYFLLFTLLCISPSFVHSSTGTSPVAETPKKTTLLDVTASIQTTIDAVSSKPEKTILKPFLQQETVSESSHSSKSSTLELELHSRDTLHRFSSSPSHKDYKTLIESRLERDSARVRSLNTKLDLAVNGVKKSDLKPVETTLEVEQSLSAGGKSKTDLGGSIVSGTSQGSGEYFSRVGIGRPAKPFYMVVDTGSDVTWVQCSPCTDCYQQTDPIYEPSSSSSYSQIMCDTDTCQALDVSACRNGGCLYQVSYGDGSYTVGDFVSETLTFGNSSSVNNVSLGCGHDNEGLFVGSAGLLGLGGGKLSFPSQLKTESFSYCLVDRDSSSSSTLIFGGSDPELNSNSVTTPLLRNAQLDTYYYLGLTGISVAGEMLTIPPSAFEVDESGGGGIIIDSGTAVTRLKTDVYNPLRDAFVQGAKDLPPAGGVAIFDTCYDLSTMKSVDVPTVALHFPGGKFLPLPAKNYLVPVDSAGTFCLAFAPTASSLSIIGNIQQQGTRVTFDLANSLVGFSANKC